MYLIFITDRQLMVSLGNKYSMLSFAALVLVVKAKPCETLYLDIFIKAFLLQGLQFLSLCSA